MPLTSAYWPVPWVSAVRSLVVTVGSSVIAGCLVPLRHRPRPGIIAPIEKAPHQHVCGGGPSGSLVRPARPTRGGDGTGRSAHAAPLEGDEQPLGAARPDPALDVGGGQRPELPALGGVLVEKLLQLVAGELVADHALP